MSNVKSQVTTEEKRPVTFSAMLGVAAASIVINVSGAFLLIPHPWNIPVTAAVFFVEVGAFLALPHIVRDFKEDGVIAKIKAVVSFAVFCAMCVICVFSGHRALSEVGNQMKLPAEKLAIEATAYNAESAALAEQARNWTQAAADMREDGYVTKAASLEERALSASAEAIEKTKAATEVTAKAEALPVLAGGQIWFILIVLEIVKAAGRFLFAIPMASLAKVRQKEIVTAAVVPEVKKPVTIPNYRTPVVSAKSQAKGYKPKKVALRTAVNPKAILEALHEAGVEGSVMRQAQALYEASGGDKIFGVYNPEAGKWAN